MIPCSVLLEGEYGRATYASVFVILGKNGVEKIVELELTAEKKKNLPPAQKQLKSNVATLKELNLI